MVPTLDQLREERTDLTQTQVAALVGVKQAQVSRWERGRRSIPIEHVPALMDAYKSSADEIVAAWHEAHSRSLTRPCPTWGLSPGQRPAPARSLLSRTVQAHRTRRRPSGHVGHRRAWGL